VRRVREATFAGTLVGRLVRGDDLLEELTGICGENAVGAGRIEGLGAVERARLAFFDQAVREYRFFELDEPLEITKLVGNVSLRDAVPFVHAHVTLADASGRAYGGHLAPGTVVFAFEFVIERFGGIELIREHDETTGLALWAME
jgi:hypothetical protein